MNFTLSIDKKTGWIYRGLFVFLFGLLINTAIFSQQILFKLGDNIIDYLNNNPPQYLTIGTFVINSPDGRADFLKYKAETTVIDTKFLVQDSTIFGVMQHENDTTSILYDITGDGILDVVFDDLIIPFWVLTDSQYTKISQNNNLRQFLDNGYNVFNSDAGPYSPGTGDSFVSSLFSQFDVSVDNRDLIFGLMQYYTYTNSPELAVMIIYSFGINYENRFGSAHPLIHLHFAESLINLGNFELALTTINHILSTNPDFVPAKVYSWQLEKNPTVKQRKYVELKTNHPNHWIVKQI